MNLQHLKYAVEVEKTHSINKASENLFMGQPNLSRAIKELENSLGITIFKRTTKGITPTPQGEEFLVYAKNILSEVEKVESYYKNDALKKQEFSISVPRASYIEQSFINFTKSLDPDKEMQIYYKETNSMRAITNILQANYNLGIIRYQSVFQNYFDILLNEKQMIGKELLEFKRVVIFSKENPLAGKGSVELDDLKDMIELAHGDPYVPSMPISDIKKAELPDYVDKRIFVYERASQFDILQQLKNSYMWVSDIPKLILERFGLVQRACVDNDKTYKDVLIHKKSYHLSNLDRNFINELNIVKGQMF